MKTVIDRIITVKEYLEKKLDIGKAGVDDV
jgi:hypothetical protein